jgi:hypothetical protein
MTAGGLASARTARLRVAPLVLLSTMLGGCDPVEETSPDEESVAVRDREGRRTQNQTNPLAEPSATGLPDGANERPVAPSVPADVAAGLVDAGPLAPLHEAPPAVDEANTADASAQGVERAVIHPGVMENVRILRFALAEDVVNREPVRVSSQFRRDSGPIHVFLEVRNDTGQDVQLSVGFRPAAQRQRSAGVWLTIPPQVRYRTRARSNARRAVGEWVCEVMDEQRRVLATQRFVIAPAVEASVAETEPD